VQQTQVDYTIKNLDDRINLVNTILEEQKDKIEKYFGNPTINYLLQGLANYILNCDHKQTHKERMQSNFENSTFELTSEAQYTIYNKTTIKKCDYKNEAIREKRDLIIHVFNKYGSSKKARRWIQDLKYDQVMIKQSEKGYIKPQLTIQIPSYSEELEIDSYWKDIFEINSINHLLNLDLFEVESWKTVLKLLPYYNKISGNVDRLVKVFNKAYHLCDFTLLQRRIIREWQCGVKHEYNDFIILKNKDVENRLNIEQSALSHNIESICNKLINAYESLFTEYYYTFITKGTYKKCKKCGQTKIIQDFYENRAICKDCFNEN
jgi:hypothetical protein